MGTMNTMGSRSGSFDRRGLPLPPISGPGRVIISVIPTTTSGNWDFQLDGNMSVVLQGNEGWLSEFVLTTLMQELLAFGAQLGAFPMTSAAVDGGRMFCKFVVGGIFWFVTMCVLMDNIDNGMPGESGGVPLGLIPVVGGGGLIILFCWAVTSMRSRQQRLLTQVSEIVNAFSSFAESWAR